MSSAGLDQAVILQLRRNILDRARRQRIAIGQIFTDAAAWNALYPGQTAIELGPNGPVARILSGEDSGP